MTNIDKFINTLPIMLQGMLGIFIVLIAIYLVIFALNKFTGKKSGDSAQGDGNTAASGNTQ